MTVAGVDISVGSRRPWLSVVIMSYKMDREVPRTVKSFCRPYQRDVDDLEYEILVVDNGSPSPLNRRAIAELAPEVRVARFEADEPSPARALNRAAALTHGEFVAIVVDGARMVSPGMLAWARRALTINPDAVVSPLAWHLGHPRSGVYGPEIEDQLLESIEWPADGYRLFDISILAGANPGGWFGFVNESTCAIMKRSVFDRLGGYDERFISPGGGYMTLEFFTRAVQTTELVVLLGEGSFHQIHGGAISGAPNPQEMFDLFSAEYLRLKGAPYQLPNVNPIYLGRLAGPARRFISADCNAPRSDSAPSTAGAREI